MFVVLRQLTSQGVGAGRGGLFRIIPKRVRRNKAIYQAAWILIRTLYDG
jgi:hypothetical protein